MQTACLIADGLSLCPIVRKGGRYERRKKKREEEIFSTTGTIRDQMQELVETNVILVIPIGGDADEFQ